LAPQRGGVLGDLAGFGLDLGLELDRRVGEVIALKRLLGGRGQGQDNRQKRDERGNETGAGKREHGWISLPAGHHRAGLLMLISKRCRGRDNFAPNRRPGEAAACPTASRPAGPPQRRRRYSVEANGGGPCRPQARFTSCW